MLYSMQNICQACGLYRPDKIIDPVGPHAVCPICGHRQRFLQLPLFIIAGASGTGKSSVCQELLGRLQNVVMLDTDILWRAEFAEHNNSGPNFFETWLRLAKNIGQSGRPVVLFGAGFGVPENIEPCVERRYFSSVHYLALVCAEESQEVRLESRPSWRMVSAEEKATQLQFNRWIKERSLGPTPRIELLDTTHVTLPQTAAEVAAWIINKISAAMPSDS